jgi:hypothetical protein
MAALEDLQLSFNSLAGTVPPSWGSWEKLQVVNLSANPELRGCLPAAWRSKVNVSSTVNQLGSNKQPSKDRLTAGTNITGFC